ncbi:MAG TPA: hypothetical protein VIK27_11020, partial [Candidatus Aquilonibacter sp.]
MCPAQARLRGARLPHAAGRRAVVRVIAPACRSCGHPLTVTFCDLGLSPPSNALTDPAALDQGEYAYPLHAYACDACFLVQLEMFETPEAIFREYAYFSSYSTTWLEHAERYVGKMIAERGIVP